MNSILHGKRALVTGGSKGIGLAVAEALAREGANVALCARNSAELEAAVKQIQGKSPGVKVSGYVTDVSKASEVKEMFKTLDRDSGGLDILINNAGVGVFRPVAQLTVEEWDRMISVNLSGSFYCSKEALGRFAKAGGGFIVNISSLAGKNPFAGGSGYNASKFGMNGFSEAMMLDHRQDNVRVSYVMPGSVDTEFSGVKRQEKVAWKIAAEDVAAIVLNILQMPQRTLISRVEVRPSRPEKN